MLGVIAERFRQKHRTIDYPEGPPPPLPERWLGRPDLSAAKAASCREAARHCPTGAIAVKDGVALDMGKCIFCGVCAEGGSGVAFSKRFDLAAFDRRSLRLGAPPRKKPKQAGAGGNRAKERLTLIRKLFRRSLALRQVSAGGCNACESDANVLATVGWDIGRFGIRFTASPRHADGVLVTGPVTPNMRLALEKTYAAIPEPKIVIACGACAISGGLYASTPSGGSGVTDILPVDLHVPGCPPHPLVLLEGMLRLLGIVDGGGDAEESGKRPLTP